MRLNWIKNDYARGFVAGLFGERAGVHVLLSIIDLCNGNLHDAILFSQIMYWHGESTETGKPRMRVRLDGELWVVKKHCDWHGECRIKERTVRECLSRLVDLGLIHYRIARFSGNNLPHIRINWEKFSELMQNVSHSQGDSSTGPNLEEEAETEGIDQNASPEDAQESDCHEMSGGVTSDVRRGDIRCQAITEITTETTTEEKDIPPDSLPDSDDPSNPDDQSEPASLRSQAAPAPDLFENLDEKSEEGLGKEEKAEEDPLAWFLNSRCSRKLSKTKKASLLRDVAVPTPETESGIQIYPSPSKLYGSDNLFRKFVIWVIESSKKDEKNGRPQTDMVINWLKKYDGGNGWLQYKAKHGNSILHRPDEERAEVDEDGNYFVRVE